MGRQHNAGIVWFRRDLRLADNPALTAAIKQCGTLVLVYIDDDDQAADWALGGASRWWLHHSLHALSKSLEKKGARLVIRQGDALQTLKALINASGASAVFWNRLYEPDAIVRDTAIKSALQAIDITVASSNGALLIEPWQILTKTETPYRVFTPFWRTAKARIDTAKPLAVPRSLPRTPFAGDSIDIDALGLLPHIRWDGGITEAWKPGERSAMTCAKAFSARAVRDYDETRDLPGVDGVSRLSPHLHFGEISPRQIWHLVRGRHADDDKGSEIYLMELGWREFSHYVLYHYPDTATEPMADKYAQFPWRDDAEAEIKAWQRGRTGIPIVDAGMRQLWHTGWMHNRVRMIVASFLVKNIRAHWLHGARWFWDTLVDADLPANSMGWQWSAGCGADAAPYFRVFNPVRQGERFDKAGDYVRHWVPEIAKLPDKYVHQPWDMPETIGKDLGFKLGKDYPKPIVDLGASRQAALDAFKTLKDKT